MQVDGACHCGRISFTAQIDPARVVMCHCTDCQVFSSSAFRVGVVAPIEGFKLQGTPKSYIKTADSGSRRAQNFCGECGTPLFTMAPENATSVTLRVGSLRQRAQLEPHAQIWQRSKVSWLDHLREIPGSPEQQAKPGW